MAKLEHSNRVRPKFALVVFGLISIPFWSWLVYIISESYFSKNSLSYVKAFSISCIAVTLTYIAVRGLFKNRTNAFQDFNGTGYILVCAIMALIAVYIGTNFGGTYALGPAFTAIVFSFSSEILRVFWQA